MKALTLTQPWATLVAIGLKRIETRSWSTPYRGPLAIHAAKSLGSMTTGEFVRLCSSEPFRSALGTEGDLTVRGAVVATCRLVDVVPIEGENAQGYTRFVCPHLDGGLTYYNFGNGGWNPATTQRDVSAEEPFGDFTPGRCRLGVWEWDGAA